MNNLIINNIDAIDFQFTRTEFHQTLEHLLPVGFGKHEQKVDERPYWKVRLDNYNNYEKQESKPIDYMISLCQVDNND